MKIQDCRSPSLLIRLYCSHALRFLIWADGQVPKMPLQKSRRRPRKRQLPGSQVRLSTPQKGGPNPLSPRHSFHFSYLTSVSSKTLHMCVESGEEDCKAVFSSRSRVSPMLQDTTLTNGWWWLFFNQGKLNLRGLCYLQSHELHTNTGPTAWVYEPAIALRPHECPHNPC